MKIFNREEIEKAIEMTKLVLDTEVLNDLKVYHMIKSSETLTDMNLQDETKKTLNLLENILHYIKLSEGKE